jgi:hypothetical protein
MRRIFAFNGDADGLCALQQLVLAEKPVSMELVTGTKRRTELLARVTAGAGDEATVLDVSFHVNREGVQRLLAAGARVRYFDHHHAGPLPRHERLEAHIDTAPKVCTSVIVDRYLSGRHRAWAAVGAYGDNLADTGRSLVDSRELEKLGTLLNYNAYGETEADLFFPPAELHRRLAPYADPLAFIEEDAAYQVLADGYAQDMQRAADLKPVAARVACRMRAGRAARAARWQIGWRVRRLPERTPC